MTAARKTLADILRTTEANVDARLVGLKLGRTCERCHGTGQYSYNQITGSRCFGCEGRGQIRWPERDLEKIIPAVQAAVDEGKLDTYMARIAGRKLAKSALDKAMKAWQDNKINYRWQDFDHPGQSFNKRQHDAWERVRALTNDITVPFSDKKTNRTAEQVRADAELALPSVFAEAIAEIKQAKIDFEAAHGKED